MPPGEESCAEFENFGDSPIRRSPRTRQRLAGSPGWRVGSRAVSVEMQRVPWSGAKRSGSVIPDRRGIAKSGRALARHTAARPSQPHQPAWCGRDARATWTLRPLWPGLAGKKLSQNSLAIRERVGVRAAGSHREFIPHPALSRPRVGERVLRDAGVCENSQRLPSPLGGERVLREFLSACATSCYTPQLARALLPSSIPSDECLWTLTNSVDGGPGAQEWPDAQDLRELEETAGGVLCWSGMNKSRPWALYQSDPFARGNPQRFDR